MMLLWDTDQEADVNGVSEGQICYQLAQLIVFCECKSWNTILSFHTVEHLVF